MISNLLASVQCAKKVVSDGLGLVDFAAGLVNSVLNLPDGQVSFFFGGGGVGGENSNYRKTVINPAHQIFLGLVKMTFGLVHTSYCLPEWQAVKLTFFAPCRSIRKQPIDSGSYFHWFYYFYEQSTIKFCMFFRWELIFIFYIYATDSN